jgi:hypothetical protein
MGVKLGLTLREERGLKVFKNKMLRGVFGPKRDEWRRMHNEELHNLYTSGHIITVSKCRRMK